METVAETKLRLVREVIEHNIQAGRGITSKAPARERERHLGFVRIAAIVLVAGVAYLSTPFQVGSPRQAVSSPPAPVAGVDGASTAAAEAPTPQIAASVPRVPDRAVFPLSVRRVVIDPGHGGEALGAVSRSGMSEKNITLDIGLRLRHLMEEAAFEVLMTRQTDQMVPLDARVAFANDRRADLFVSIHVNWLDARNQRPLETYYIGPTDDPATVRLASRENQDSGYSLADYRQLLERVFIDARRDESRRLARAVHTELFTSLRGVNPGLQNRGVKTAPFVVLAGTQMPAILAEVSCLSNDDEVKLLKSADYREAIALALLNGIRAYANSLRASPTKGS
jgi:N-acetylmuramoyl-L-alanine amidase